MTKRYLFKYAIEEMIRFVHDIVKISDSDRAILSVESLPSILRKIEIEWPSIWNRVYNSLTSFRTVF